jgi:hypothetical protein
MIKAQAPENKVLKNNKVKVGQLLRRRVKR